MVLSSQLLGALGLTVYVLAVLFLTRIPYQEMVRRGMKPVRALYYNRKLVHILAQAARLAGAAGRARRPRLRYRFGFIRAGIEPSQHRPHRRLR